jgi:hypothetical protein
VQLILDTQPKGGAAAGGAGRDDAVDRSCQDLLAKLPQAFDGASPPPRQSVQSAAVALLRCARL